MYKYKEAEIIQDFKNYIDETYSEHYKTENNNIECFDAWIALGDATPTFRNTALKYLWRYGKKNGSNKADLIKAMHYILMCLYNDHYKKGELNGTKNRNRTTKKKKTVHSNSDVRRTVRRDVR